jgi:hypothetical protein
MRPLDTAMCSCPEITSTVEHDAASRNQCVESQRDMTVVTARVERAGKSAVRSMRKSEKQYMISRRNRSPRDIEGG